MPDCIRVVLDNLSSHSPIVLYQTFPTAEIAAWQHQRNASAARINWMFSTEKREPKWHAPIQRLTAKNHNHCAELLMGPML